MTDYKAIFDAVEATLFEVGSRNLSVQQIQAELENYKHREGKQYSDEEYYSKLVRIVFYSGFRAQTVTDRLPVIEGYFGSYQLVARYKEAEIEAIIADPRMIRNRGKIEACATNARQFEKIVSKFGTFSRYVESFNPKQSDFNLLRFKEDLQERFQWLGGITTYHFLTSIGLPVLKPDRVIKRIFSRLGLVEANAGELAFIEEGRNFSRATGHPIRYIDIVFVAYGQSQSKEIGLDHGICLEKNPHCGLCKLQSVCNYSATR